MKAKGSTAGARAEVTHFLATIDAARDLLRSETSPSLEARCEIQIARRLSMVDGAVTDAAEATLLAGSLRLPGPPERFRAAAESADLLSQIRQPPWPTAGLTLPERRAIIDHRCDRLPDDWPDLTHPREALARYRDVVRDHAPDLMSFRAFYADQRRLVWYGSADGTSVVQLHTDASLIITIRTRTTSGSGFSFVSLAAAEPASLLLADVSVAAAAADAQAIPALPTIEPGPTTVILDPHMAGLFAHEAIGHLSEADYVRGRPAVAALMGTGRIVGPPDLTIVDDPTRPELRGSYAYDDEGTPARPVALIEQGRVAGRLQSRATAQHFGVEPTGHARALDARRPPLVRMSNTFVAPGRATFDDLIADVRDGLYVRKPMGGETRMESFAFGASDVFRVRHGRLGERVQPILLAGDLFETLAQVDGIGSDLTFETSAGGCAKEDQEGLPVDSGGPHLRIQSCLAVPL